MEKKIGLGRAEEGKGREGRKGREMGGTLQHRAVFVELWFGGLQSKR